MKFAIGVDLGGTNLRVAAVREDGQILDRAAAQVKLLAGRDAVIDELGRAARALIEKHRRAGTLAGVGVGVPGIIYLDTGQLRKSPNLPGWEDYPVRDEIERRLGNTPAVSVTLDNDANVAALGEMWLGAGRSLQGAQDSLGLITLGTGVGGGLIFNGRIWHGFLGMAGELGHINVLENGFACGCGSQGCLETETSATAVVRQAADAIGANPGGALARAVRDGETITAALVYRCAQGGDSDALRIFARVGKYLGIALAGLVNGLNLPLYVIGGGVAAAWDAFAPAMFEQLQRRSYIFAEGRTRVVQSELHGDAGLLGAARLALQS